MAEQAAQSDALQPASPPSARRLAATLGIAWNDLGHDLATSISIDAPTERVWSVLLDFARYAQWNPFIRSIEGAPAVGSVIRVRMQPPGGKAMTFNPVILCCDAGREFRWKGKLVLPGVFDGEHYFQLVADGAGSNLFTHGERFTGLLVPLLRGTLERDTRAGFEAMNRALKQRVERGGA